MAPRRRTVAEDVGASVPVAGALPIPDAERVGRPHVFGVDAKAIRLSDDGSLVAAEFDVALLMTPGPGEQFAMRTPRGSIGSGGLFVLRCAGLGGPSGVVARAESVSEPAGLHFDLVSAQLVEPRGADAGSGADGPAADDELPLAASELLPGPARRPRRDEGAAPRADARAHRHASASSVQVGGVATIRDHVSMTLVTAVRMGEPIRLVAPRGAVAPGSYFSLRYFDASGAKRALLRADAVCCRPGMLDQIEAMLIRPPVRTPERQAYRVAFARFFTAEVVSQAGPRSTHGRLFDISASGVCFRLASPIVPGDRLRLADPSLGDLDGAELRVVRQDHHDRQRFGAEFLEANRGASVVAEILGFDRAERERRRRALIHSIRMAGKATAAPLTIEECRILSNRRMATRRSTGEPGSSTS